MYKFVFALGVLVFPAQGARLSYFSNAHAGDVERDSSVTIDAPSDSLEHRDSVSFSSENSRAVSTYNLHAGFDRLGVSFSGTASKDGSDFDDISTAGVFELLSTDHLVFNVDSGFLKLDALFDGSFSPPDRSNQMASFFTVAGNGLVSYNAAIIFSDSSFQVFGHDSGSMQLPQPDLIFDNTTNTYSTTMAASFYAFFTGGALDLVQHLRGQWACSTGTSNLSCSFTGDFLNTAAIGGALVVDAQGNPIPGATITSQSGFDYTRSLSTPAESTVPEPSTMLLMSGGFVALIARRFRTVSKGRINVSL